MDQLARPSTCCYTKRSAGSSPASGTCRCLRNIGQVAKSRKRKNPVSLVYYRQTPVFLPHAMLNFLGLLGGGMAQPTEQEIVSKGLDTRLVDVFSLPDMVERFDFKRISLGGPVFDLVKLRWMNSEYLRALNAESFFQAMRATVFSDEYLRAIAPLVQTRIETLGQFGDLTDFFFKDDVMPTEDMFVPKKRTLEDTLAFAAEMLPVLEAADWTTESIDAGLRELLTAKEWSVQGRLRPAARHPDRQNRIAAAARITCGLRKGTLSGPCASVPGKAEGLPVEASACYRCRYLAVKGCSIGSSFGG